MVSGLSNTRLLFPGETILGRAILLVVFVAAPVLAAFLATMQQLIGGGMVLLPAVVLVLGASLVPFGFCSVLLSPSVSTKQLERASVQQMWLQAAMLLGACVCLYFYVVGNDKLAEFANVQDLLSPTSLLVAFIDGVARSTLTRIVSLDLVLFGLWKQHVEHTARNRADGEGKRAYENSMSVLNKLLVPEHASVIVPAAANGSEDQQQVKALAEAAR
jgi:hypothetical protein